MTAESSIGPASETEWREERIRFRPLHMVRTWLFSAIGLLIAAWIVPGAHINDFWAALLVAAVIAALNAILPPIIAAIRLPLTLVFGFLAILVLDALMLLAADAITDERMLSAAKKVIGGDMLEKTLPGFGELFRMLSYEQVGAAAMLSRATAGTYRGAVVVSVPGSPKAVALAWEKLIEPELAHLAWEVGR